MTVKTIGENEYLFLEKGSFNGKHRFGGRDAYMVFSR